MKKTWIKAILMTVLTLALVVGLFGAYTVAQASVESVSITYTGSLTLAVGDTIELTANPTRASTTPTLSYSWTKSNGNVDLTNATTSACTVTALTPGTSNVSVSVSDSETPAGQNASVTITVSNAAITGAPTSAMSGGATKQLYVTGVSTATGVTNTWSVTDSSTNVITVSSSGLVTAVGAGTKTVQISSDNNGHVVTASVNISVNPTISISPTSANINTSGGTQTVTLDVDYGGVLYPASTTRVDWTSNNTYLATVASGSSTLDSSSQSAMVVTANTANRQGEVIITAKIYDVNGNASTYTSSIQVRTSGYFELTYSPTNQLSKNGNTIVVLAYTARNADGTVNTAYNGYASWSWTTSYFALSSNSMNNYRHQFNNGVATVELQTRGYNTRSSGTPVYAWIDGYKSSTRLSRQMYITGYASTPQTGQDFTPVYVLGACCLAVAAVWVIWYAKKKRTAAR